MRQTFSPFGQIMEIRVFPDKGYSFVRYVNVINMWWLQVLMREADVALFVSPGSTLTKVQLMR